MLGASHGGWYMPLRRVIENKHSNRDQSTVYLECECSYRRAEYTEEEEEEEEVVEEEEEEEGIQRRSSACHQ